MHIHAIILLGDNMILNTFGDRIKHLREKQTISQSKLAQITGIVREQISRIENGQINPTLETVFKLSEALNISMSELFNFDVIGQKQEISSLSLKPFVKWAGGKTQIISKILKLIPNSFNTYYEPFLGGGALLLQLKPINAVVSDYNLELITAYNCFKNEEEFMLMIEEIIKHQRYHTEEYYYQVREMDRSTEFINLPNFKRAARMIYLNKACFNGLYRVNSKGFFNVPSGKYTTVNAYDEILYDNLSRYLSRSSISINNDDFEKAVLSAKRGDFVYFDPPYDTFDEKNSFTTYTKNAFGKDEQKRLAMVFKDLDNRGAKVMLSNHNTEFIRDLYSDFNIKVINARRSINSVSSGRGSVEEVIITNYTLENTYDNN
jgi:DNA adenine methylase